MKALQIIFAILIYFSTTSQATKLRQGTSQSTISRIEDLETTKWYLIKNKHFKRELGLHAYGWYFTESGGFWKLINEGGNKYTLENDVEDTYLSITSSGSTSTTGTQSSNTKLYLSNGNNGICISRYSNSKYLRMYYKYQFPFGVYRTNTASSCGAWELFEFISYY